MKRLTILTFILLISFKIFGQISIGYFPFQSILSVNTNCNKIIFTDIRMETNTFFTNINPELNLFLNFKRNENSNYYAGLGVNINPFYEMNYLSFVNGYSFTIGARFKPLTKYEKFNVIFEISPYANKYFDGGVFRTNLGLSYDLKKDK